VLDLLVSALEATEAGDLVKGGQATGPAAALVDPLYLVPEGRRASARE